MICLFGGTFDPVHLGHLHAAAAVREALGVAEIRLVLSARPSHKGTPGASIEHRWEMLCLACATQHGLTPDDREMRRARPSFTVETLLEVKAEFPGESLAWVIGSDAYALLPSWYRWQEVLKLTSLVVLKRPGHPLLLDDTMAELTRAHQVESLEGCHEGGILILDDEMREMAAQDIRATIAAGRSTAHLLPEPVATYIKAHHLYGGC